ncbi:MAG: hypothetical protein PHC52_11895 [Syntrophales bacterium]|nr:hypothetical protein [Syntrophales bacterium]
MPFAPNGYNANLVMLVDIEPGRRLDALTWTQAATPNTACWYVSHPEGVPSKVEADGAALTVKASLALCQGTAQTYFYDSATERLYVHITGDGTPATAAPYLASYHWRRFGTDTETYDGHQYLPVLPEDSVPNVSAATGRFHEGGTSLSFGAVKILNGDGRFDTLFDAYIWEAKRIRVRIGEKGKGDANYTVIWDGWTGDVEWDDNEVSIATEDLRTLVI